MQRHAQNLNLQTIFDLKLRKRIENSTFLKEFWVKIRGWDKTRKPFKTVSSDLKM